MKRELKFRAWHKELKMMLYPPDDFASHTLAVDKNGKTVEFKDEGYADIPPVYFPASMLWDGRYYVKGKPYDKG